MKIHNRGYCSRILPPVEIASPKQKTVVGYHPQRPISIRTRSLIRTICSGSSIILAVYSVEARSPVIMRCFPCSKVVRTSVSLRWTRVESVSIYSMESADTAELSAAMESAGTSAAMAGNTYKKKKVSIYPAGSRNRY